MRPAWRELREAAKYYEHRVPGLGFDLIQEVRAAIRRILMHYSTGLTRLPPCFRSKRQMLNADSADPPPVLKIHEKTVKTVKQRILQNRL